MSDTIIRAQNMSFTVPVFKPSEQKITVSPSRLLTAFYSGRDQRKTKSLLVNISFSVKKGQRVGLIGRNGAGKTTLLRLISGIYQPNGGVLEVNGSTQGLFNIQTGMNDAATGIENIYLRGLQMGMSIAKIHSVIESVIEFAEIGEAINGIFGDYSTGMKLRLSVAISTMMKPDILILDEWVGSGDAAFAEKLNMRMNMLIDSSSALVMATHSPELMKSVCTHALVLEKGVALFYGPTDEAQDYYQNSVLN